MAKARESDVVERFDRLADSVLLTEPEAARVVGFSPHALKAWRLSDKRHGKGPTPTYIHESVRYRVDDLRDWRATVSKRQV